jgi:hypothetical protein
MACENSLGSIWPDDIYIVCGVGNLIEPDDVSTIFPTMIGWKIRVIRAGAPLNLGSNSNGSPYFDYTAITGEATWSIVAQNTEEFIIQAYKPAE